MGSAMRRAGLGAIPRVLETCGTVCQTAGWWNRSLPQVHRGAVASRHAEFAVGSAQACLGSVRSPLHSFPLFNEDAKLTIQDERLSHRKASSRDLSI